MTQLLKQSTAFTFRIGPFLDDTDGKTAETGLTIAQGDIQISKAGGAFAQTSASPTTTHDTDGWYQCPLTATDTDTVGTLDVQIAVSGALPVWRHFTVVPAMVFDSLIAGTDILQADMTQILGTAVSAPATAGLLDVNAIQISGDATAANNAESFFDGTGYAGTNNVIPTVTTLTGHTAQTGDSYARLGAPAGASVSADIAAVKSDTAAILTDTGTTLDTLIKDIPTVAEFEARTLAAADYTVVSDLGTVQSGDAFARLGAPAGASVSADVAAVKSDTAAILTDTGTTLDTLIKDIPTNAEFEARSLVAADYTVVGDLIAASAIADAVWDEAIADHAGVGSTGAALAAAGGSGDPWATALPGAYGAGTAGKIVGDNLNAPVGTVDTVVDGIATTLGVAGAGLTAVPWNAAWDAEVQSEATDALNAYDPPTNAEMEARTLLAADYTVVSDLGTVQTGDAFARLGAPAGASVSADIASMNTTVDDIFDDVGDVRSVADDILVDTGTTLDTLIKDIPTVAEFEARTLVAADYVVVTDTIAGATTVGSVTAGVTLADDAITAAKFDESTAFPLASADTGATALARTGADADTLETLSDQVDGIAASAIADAVWDEALAGHAGAGSAGAALAAASAPTAAAVADAVWDELVADHAGVGSTGAALAAAGGSGDPWATALPGAYGAGTAGKLLSDLGNSGTYSYSDTVDDGSGNLLDGVYVLCATDDGFTNIVAATHTNASGAFTVYSDQEGTHYLRLQLAGYEFADQEVVLA